MKDTIYRDDAMSIVEENIGKEYISPTEKLYSIRCELSALPSAEAVKVAYICDGRKCDADCRECFRTIDIEHAKDFKLMGDTYYQQTSADSEPTVIRCKTLLNAEDFEAVATRIRKENRNVIVIPCETEVASAEAVSREVYEETDGVVTIEKQNAKEVGEIKHIVIRSPNYTRYFYNESMPLPAEAVHKPDYSYEADMVKRLRQAEAVQGWIPCSDGLPNELEAVNVTWVNHNPPVYYQYTKDVPNVDTAVYYNGAWYWWDATVIDLLGEYGGAYIHGIEPIDKDIEVTAWMPLPKPYKGGGSE